MEEIQEINLLLQRVKTFLGGGNPNLCTNKQLLSEVFRFYIAKTFVWSVSILHCQEHWGIRSWEKQHGFCRTCALRWLLFCPVHWLAINKGTAVCLCVVISWQPSQTYSAALQSLWPASRDQCSDTVWPRRSVSFTVCQRPQNFLAFITISWRQISGEFSHGTWLLHFRNSSESIRKNHDCNGDRHTR